MSANLQDKVGFTLDMWLYPTGSNPWSHGFHLTREAADQSDSRSPKLTGEWKERENTEHSDTEDDVKLHQLMEDIKRYIRSIDISNL
jgi:hypothetical protein